jgi:hypothetical protein
MTKRLKFSLVFSLISSVLAASFWYLFTLYSGREVDSLLEVALVFGGMNFLFIFVISYMIIYRRL